MSELSDEPSSEQIRRARAKKSATGFLAALARHAQQFGDPVSLMIDDDDDQNPGSVQGAHHPASHPEGSPKPSPEACPKTARKAPHESLFIIVEAKPAGNASVGIPQMLVSMAAIQDARQDRTNKTVFGMLSDGTNYTFACLNNNKRLLISRNFQWLFDRQTILRHIDRILLDAIQSSPHTTCYSMAYAKRDKQSATRMELLAMGELFQTLQGVPRWKDESRRWNVPSRSWKRNPPRTTPPTVTTPPALSVAALAPPPAAVIVPPPATVISSVCVDLTDQHSKDKSTNYNILQERLRCMDAKSLEENLSWSQMRLPPDKPSTEEFPPDLIWTLLQSASFPQELYLWLSANYTVKVINFVISTNPRSTDLELVTTDHRAARFRPQSQDSLGLVGSMAWSSDWAHDRRNLRAELKAFDEYTQDIVAFLTDSPPSLTRPSTAPSTITRSTSAEETIGPSAAASAATEKRPAKAKSKPPKGPTHQASDSMNFPPIDDATQRLIDAAIDKAINSYVARNPLTAGPPEPPGPPGEAGLDAAAGAEFR
ncbi:hypothetical protein MMC12_003627 [Toensbergia leucococca]|nr:hypothetical protein [Toensbergia leucococca]